MPGNWMQLYLLGREDDSTVATRLDIRIFAVFAVYTFVN